MKHTIGIPDWVWEFWQEREGVKNPANALRNELYKITALYQLQEYQQSQDLLPDSINFDVDDTPTSIILERAAVCHDCRNVMRKGDEAFWYTTPRGKKAAAHPKCWKDNQNSRVDH
jgi:hypothetical protein